MAKFSHPVENSDADFCFGLLIVEVPGFEFRAQFVTLNFCLAILCLRSSLNLCGIQISWDQKRSPGIRSAPIHATRRRKSWERLFDGEIGFSINDGKKILAALQSAVVAHEAKTFCLFVESARSGMRSGQSRIARPAGSDCIRHGSGAQSSLDVVSGLLSGNDCCLRAAIG
jgi:hypothetical protein